MKGKILIIEDEVEIADLISLYLEKEGITTYHSTTGEDGLRILNSEELDLIILDINLPGIDGFETLQEIRKNSNTPVIIVSARSDDADHILGFGIGADDFVSKPFSPKVLSARVRAHLRRGSIKSRETTNRLKFGDFTLDFDAYNLTKSGTPVKLSPKELEILIYLARNEGVRRSLESIYEEVWGSKYGDISTVSVHIRRIRKKIEEDSANPKYIKTSHGFGYYFTREECDL